MTKPLVFLCVLVLLTTSICLGTYASTNTPSSSAAEYSFPDTHSPDYYDPDANPVGDPGAGDYSFLQKRESDAQISNFEKYERDAESSERGRLFDSFLFAIGLAMLGNGIFLLLAFGLDRVNPFPFSVMKIITWGKWNRDANDLRGYIVRIALLLIVGLMLILGWYKTIISYALMLLYYLSGGKIWYEV